MAGTKYNPHQIVMCRVAYIDNLLYNLSSGLCDAPEGWHGEVGGEVQEWGVYINHTSDTVLYSRN